MFQFAGLEIAEKSRRKGQHPEAEEHVRIAGPAHVFADDPVPSHKDEATKKGKGRTPVTGNEEETEQPNTLCGNLASSLFTEEGRK